MAVGDNLNDFDMVKNSGIGVAVANAYDELKNIGIPKTKIQLMAGNSIVVSKLEAIFTSILKRIVEKSKLTINIIT